MSDVILNIPYINQRYGVWDFGAGEYFMKDLPGSYLKGKYTVKHSGCGPCCTAMLLSWATGYFVDPLDLTDKYIAGKGSAHTILGHEAKERDLDYIYTDDIDLVIEHLKLGHPALNVQGKGLFTSSGHFIALIGITDDGMIAVNDPYSAARTYRRSGKLYSPNDIDKTTKHYGHGYTILIPKSRSYRVHVNSSLNIWKKPVKKEKFGYLEDLQKIKVRAGSIQQKSGANFVPVRKTSGVKGFNGKYPVDGYADLDYLYVYKGSRRL